MAARKAAKGGTAKKKAANKRARPSKKSPAKATRSPRGSASGGAKGKVSKKPRALPKKSTAPPKRSSASNPRKRLKKSVAARAVARAEAILSAEKNRANARIQGEKDKAKRVAAQGKAKAKAQRESARKAKKLLREEHKAALLAEKSAQKAEKQRRLQEQKAARQRAKLEAESARAKARAEAQALALADKALALVDKAQALADREKSKAAAKKEKQARARKKGQLKKSISRLQRDLRESRNHAHKRLGTDLATLTGSLLDLLSQRPDVEVILDHRGPPLSIEELAAHVEDVPPDILLWYADAGAVAFRFELNSNTNAPRIQGQLYVPPLEALTWTPRGRYLLSTQCDGAVGDGAPSEWSSLEDFLNTGAASLFCWDLSFMSAFAQHSAPRLTPARQLLETMVQKGLTEPIAKSLLRWLGEKAHLPLHVSDTTEGKRRLALLKNAPDAGTELNAGLLADLRSGEPIEKGKWQTWLASHDHFLRDGGGGGTWGVTVHGGLPHAHYRAKNGESPPLGQADYSREHLSSLRAKGARLAFSNFVGAAGENMVFSNCDLTGSCFAHSSFEGTEFHGSDLSGCDFSQARLVGADFRRTKLKGTNFEGADLTGADFSGALTVGTKFGGANVRGIKY